MQITRLQAEKDASPRVGAGRDARKYGLILPEKSLKKPVFQASRNVFGDDSDSEEETKTKKSVLLRPSQNINRQAKSIQEKAVSEDPTVYQYDEVYETMTDKKNDEKAKVKEDKKPRYIENLLKAASKRKIENERRVERQVQKEREKEGDEFADKEVFVTAAYKKKLEELRLEEEKEKREEFLESVGDVTKQQDLGGFYRHLYEQKLGSARSVEAEGKIEDKMLDKEEKATKQRDEKLKIGKQSENKVRNYRKRKTSNDKSYLSEGEIEDSDDEINRVKLDNMQAYKKSKVDENIDADSDFSVDDPSSDEEYKSAESFTPVATPQSTVHPEVPIEPEKIEKNLTPEKSEQSPKKQDKETKPKIDIWKKRTVGELFHEALKRYYERKAARGH